MNLGLSYAKRIVEIMDKVEAKHGKGFEEVYPGMADKILKDFVKKPAHAIEKMIKDLEKLAE